MTPEMSNAAIGEKVIGAERAGDFDTVLTYMHPEVEISEPESLPYGGIYIGREGLTTLLQKMMEVTTGLTIGQSKIHGTRDGCVIELEVTFTSRKTGKQFRTAVVEIWQITDGLIRLDSIYHKDVAATNVFFAEG